jgi:G3E family GTPase
VTALPVSVLTGFLGAGKTTLLARALADPRLAGAAVLINEVGELPLDHHLVREVRGDVTVLGSGCVCCSVRGDLVRALGDLAGARARGELPAVDRVVVETTGLADPVGVLAGIAGHPAAARWYRPAAVVTVVDGALGRATLDRHPEAIKQAALADRLVVSKPDLADAAEVEAVRRRLRALNHGAPILAAAHGDLDPAVLTDDAAALPPAGPRPDDAGCPPGCDHHHDHAAAHGYRALHASHDGVLTAAAEFAAPLRAGALSLWLELVTQLHGDALLRIKGVVALDGEPLPVAVHAVQHLVFPARRLPAWPDDARRSRLVLITRGMSPGALAGLRHGLAEAMDQPLA